MDAPSEMNIVVFDIWSDYGHFRRGYTTTSPLTYPFPTRTALAGIIAAILGMERDSYYDVLGEGNSLFALQILNPIKKVTMNQNLVDTKQGYFLWDNGGQRTQIPFEYLKDPHYRVFVWLRDAELFDKLCDFVRQRKTTFTLYMGITEHIAQFSPYRGGCLRAERRRNEKKAIIHSIGPLPAKINVSSLGDSIIGYAKVPGFFEGKNRGVKKYLEFYYEETGKPLEVIGVDYYRVGGEINIIPF